MAWHGLSARQAAKVLGCATATFFVRLHLAVQPGKGRTGMRFVVQRTTDGMYVIPVTQTIVDAYRIR